jgi:hypothetical protein
VWRLAAALLPCSNLNFCYLRNDRRRYMLRPNSAMIVKFENLSADNSHGSILPDEFPLKTYN